MRDLFEKAISENPDDAAAHAAYADWLTEQGDPRGEFIRVQLALEDETLDASRRTELRAEEKRLLDAHVRQWLGPELTALLFPRWFRRLLPKGEFEFRRGWLDRLSIPELDMRVAQALARSTATRSLRSLSFNDGVGWEGQWPTLSRAPFVPTLREFRLGYSPLQATGGAPGAGEFFVQTRSLESLNLMATEVETEALFAVPLPRLRILEVHCLSSYRCDILAQNPTLTNLERLAFHPHGADPEEPRSFLGLGHLRAIARSPHLTALRDLEFHLTDVGDDGCRELVESGLLGRLRHLSLQYGRVTNEGARILAESGQLRQLELLDLDHNALTRDGFARLKATGIRVSAIDQHAPDDNDYLYSGDME
jgi:uncharacterized protein (TIGR02996 family)